MVALGGVVEDNIEDELEPGCVECLDHGLELGDLTADPTGANLGRIARVRSEEAQAAVAPVVVEALGAQEGVVDVVVDRKQLHRGDAQADEVFQRRRCRKPRVRAPQLRRHPRVELGEALDVGLVDDRVGVGDRGRGVVAPVEAITDDEAPGNVRCRVQAAEAVRVAGQVRQDRLAQVHVAADSPSVRVQKQLVGIAPQSGRWLVWTSDAIPVSLARADSGHEAVPDARIAFRQCQLFLRARIIEQAQVHGFGDL